MDEPEPLKEQDTMADDKAETGMSDVNSGSSDPVEPAKNPPQQQYYQQPPQQYQQPPPYAQPPVEPTSMTLGRLFAGAIWVLALLGGILLLVGQVMLDVADYDDKGLIKAGHVLSHIGVFMFGLPMIVAGAYHGPSQPHVRLGLITGGALLIVSMAWF